MPDEHTASLILRKAGAADVALDGPFDFRNGAHLERLAAAVREHGAAAVALLDGRQPLHGIMALVAAAAAWRVDVLVAAAALPVLVRRGRVPTVFVGGMRTVAFPPRNPESGHRTPLPERLFAALLLAMCAPLLALLALVVRLEDGGPAFFVQERFGAGGRPFRMLKLRTMRPAAEAQQRTLQRRIPFGRLFKLDDDPRATRVGRWLRRHGLDELPQLLHVVRGEMRLVGPRPLPAADSRHYGQPWHSGRLGGPPGLTGLWQVSGRNALSFDEMCCLDIWYLCNRSPALDLRILLRTVVTVLRPERS